MSTPPTLHTELHPKTLNPKTLNPNLSTQILWDSNAPMADYPVGHHVMEIKEAHQSRSFRKLGVPYFGVLIVRILLFRVLY